MAISAEQVATLRAQLAGDFTEYELRWERLEPTARATYGALLSAAFCEAVERRFNESTPIEEIIEFVSSVRARSERVTDDLDPRVAERMILAVYTNEEIDDVDSQTRGVVQMIVLAALVSDAHLDDLGLDELLGEARKLADQWLE
ncbi:hypothetical protein GCM10010191_36300 [Actinomadura vinacea]|uniref:Uncharacterized protein n=1 Tax=Actinomadura vinacea TaxID=115336 RepID=A0ABN3J3K1_9ACTN